MFNLNGKSPFEEAQFVVKQIDSRNHITKVRVSSKFHVSVSYKCPTLLFQNIASTTFGLHGSNLLNERRVFKFGAQV